RVVHGVRLEDRLDVTLGCTRVTDQVQQCGRVRHVQCRTRSTQNLEHHFTFVGRERVNVDQGIHVTAAQGRVGDHEAAVGVSDENHRTAGALGDEGGDVGRVD